MSDNIPVFSVDLIQQLDNAYPELSPDPNDTERELWMKAGERRLVRILVSRVKQDEEDSTNMEN